MEVTGRRRRGRFLANDGQYYCWRGKEIPRTRFEIAVSTGPLLPEEKRWLVSQP